MRWWWWLLIGLAACGIAVIVLVPVIAAIDNRIRWQIARDIRVVQRHHVGDTTIGQLVGLDAEWSGIHRDEVWVTYVTCRRLRDGAAESFHWEVRHGQRFRGERVAGGILITALTRDTAKMTPHLVPEGLPMKFMPEHPGMAVEALYQEAEYCRSKARARE
jgi:hypothetical protein